MRPIEFRGWCESLRVMYTTEMEVNMWRFTVDNGIPQTDYILMQFTGLLDKNGTKIFEGDIIEFVADGDDFFVLYGTVQPFNYYQFDIKILGRRYEVCKKHEPYSKKERRKRTPRPMIRCWDKEIIGNIYENPELLEAKNGCR